MAKNTHSEKGKIISAAVLSALVGVGIGMLFAPKKETITEKISSKAERKMKRKLDKQLKKPIEVLERTTNRPPLL